MALAGSERGTWTYRPWGAVRRSGTVGQRDRGTESQRAGGTEGKRDRRTEGKRKPGERGAGTRGTGWASNWDRGDQVEESDGPAAAAAVSRVGVTGFGFQWRPASHISASTFCGGTRGASRVWGLGFRVWGLGFGV